MEQAAKRPPNVFTATADLSREDWLAYRRQGIGGSDAAAVLGISPFRTGVDLYYDKLGLPVDDSGDNWVAMEMGNLLEDLVARIFEKKTGLKTAAMKFMFQHADHPFMLADIDCLVILPDGSNAILEIKTTNYNARDKWEYDGKPIVPQYYEAQGRHYMAVMDLDRVYYCCLYGNNEDEVIIRSIDRDMKYEAELIALEKEMERLKALIVADMDGGYSAVCEDESGSYTVTFKPRLFRGYSEEQPAAVKRRPSRHLRAVRHDV